MYAASLLFLGQFYVKKYEYPLVVRLGNQKMSTRIEAFKAKFMTLLTAISEKLDDKLGKTEAAVSANKLSAPFELRVTGDATGSEMVHGDETVVLEVALSAAAEQRLRAITPVKEITALSIDQVKQYDLQTLLGTDAALYDLTAVTIEVRVKDTIAGSPTLNAFVNAHAYVVYGIKDDRYVMVSNESGKVIDCYVRVTVPPKRV